MDWCAGARRSSSSRCEIAITGRALIGMSLLLLVGDLRWTGAAVLAAMVHELGHLTVLWILERRIRWIRVDLFGAVIATEPLDDRSELVCALAGPAAGLLLCLFRLWIPRTAVCAFVQSIWNLLPVFPLDGGRVWRVLRNICCKAWPKGVQ